MRNRFGLLEGDNCSEIASGQSEMSDTAAKIAFNLHAKIVVDLVFGVCSIALSLVLPCNCYIRDESKVITTFWLFSVYA